MTTGDRDKPFIWKFRHDGFFYIYDVNTNRIVEVEKPVFDMIDRSGEADSSTSTPGLRKYRLEIARAREEHGLFSSFRPGRTTMFLGCAEDIKEYNGKYGINQMLIELTRDCNLMCAYCPTSGKYAETGARRSEMTPATCRKAVDFLCTGNNAEKSVISLYGGEPLSRFGLVRETVEYVKQKYGGNKFSFSMTTNGTLLTKETMKFLIENDFLLSLSLDGPQPVNDRYREYRNPGSGKSTFQTIKKNLELLKSLNGDYYSRNVLISSVLTPPFDRIDDIFDFFSNDKELCEIYAKGKIRTSIVDTEETTFLEDFGLEESMKELNRLHDKMVERLKGFLLDGRMHPLSFEKSTVYPVLKNLAKRPIKKLYNYAVPLGACHIGSRRLFVRTNGDFYICERSGDNYKIGHVDTGFDYERIAGYYRKLEEVLDDCKNCWAINHCERCWVQLGNLDEFTGKKKEDFCSYNKGMIETAFKVYVELLKKDPDCLKILGNGAGTGTKD